MAISFTEAVLFLSKIFIAKRYLLNATRYIEWQIIIEDEGRPTSKAKSDAKSKNPKVTVTPKVPKEKAPPKEKAAPKAPKKAAPKVPGPQHRWDERKHCVYQS